MHSGSRNLRPTAPAGSVKELEIGELKKCRLKSIQRMHLVLIEC